MHTYVTCFQFWLLHISCLHPPWKADVIRFWNRVSFSYCQWLRDDKIMSAGGTWSLTWKEAIFDLANIRLKRSRTCKIWCICALSYFTCFIAFLRISCSQICRQFKSNWYLSTFMIWYRNFRSWILCINITGTLLPTWKLLQ